MKKINLAVLAVISALVFAGNANAVHSTAVLTTAVGGYDLVSYHNGEKPLPGNGNHVFVYEGVNYLFANEANKLTFKRDPQKYLPAYGGWCAFGVREGKKFVGDPDVWEIVDGKLYLNLNNKVKGVWRNDISGNISKANQIWPDIKDKSPESL